MGTVLARLGAKETSKEKLERICREIVYLEDYKYRSANQQKNLIGLIFFVSAFLCIMYSLILYFYYLPLASSWQQKAAYFVPIIITPAAMYLLKSALNWFYNWSITGKEYRLRTLKREKSAILDNIKETETYKVAKELLEKYDPSSLISPSAADLSAATASIATSAAGPRARYRGTAANVSVRSMNTSFSGLSSLGSPEPARSMLNSTLPAMHLTQRQATSPGPFASPPRPLTSGAGVAPGPAPYQYPSLPAPRLCRPIVSQERSVVEKLVDYVVGDGPNNRYALICRVCCSHNGMALSGEFEYLAFRCCYCFSFNPARKQRLCAPSIMAPPADANGQPTVFEPESDADEKRSEDGFSTSVDVADKSATIVAKECSQETLLDTTVLDSLSVIAESESQSNKPNGSARTSGSSSQTATPNIEEESDVPIKLLPTSQETTSGSVSSAQVSAGSEEPEDKVDSADGGEQCDVGWTSIDADEVIDASPS